MLCHTVSRIMIQKVFELYPVKIIVYSKVTQDIQLWID
jgi:hypothetical protein